MTKTKAEPRRIQSGFCSALPWPVQQDYDPHKQCYLDGCICPCHQQEDEMDINVGTHVPQAEVDPEIDRLAAVARTTYMGDARGVTPPRPWEALSEGERNIWRGVIRALLEAL